MADLFVGQSLWRSLRASLCGVKQWMLLPPYAEVITANIAVQVVIKGALLTILEENADEAGATNEDRRHFFYDDTSSPLAVIQVDNFVAEPQVETVIAVHIRS